MAEQVFDVIVIGAGVMGSSAAYHAAKRGLKTLLLEQFDFLHHRGSSHGESRTTRVTYPEHYYPKMVLESSRLWEEAENDAGFKVYFETTHLDIGPPESEYLAAVVESCRKNDIPVRVLDADQVSAEFRGAFRLPEDWIGVVNEHGGVIKPTKAVAMFQSLCLRYGALLRDNQRVVGIERDESADEIVVSTADGGEFRSRKCVIAAGAWTGNLIEKARGITLPIQPLETTVLYWKIRPGFESDFTIESGFPTFASFGDTYVYGTPSLEYPGLIKIPAHSGRPCAPEERTWTAEESILPPLQIWIETLLGGKVDAENAVVKQSCMYSMTPDEDFFIDFLGGDFGRNAVVCGGFSGHGFKMAPIIGRIAADLAQYGTTEGVELKHFKIDRFRNNSKGNVKPPL